MAHECRPVGKPVWTKFREYTRIDAYRCARCWKLVEIETVRDFDAEDAYV